MEYLNKKTVKDIAVAGKKVLVRCDFNVPMQNGVITDDKRIKGALQTIQYLIEQNAKVILASHFGRPKGEFKPEFSLKPVAERLSKLLNCPVIMASDVAGEDAKAKAAALQNGQVMMLENVRFIAGETKNDTAFSKELASLADIFVNDAFGTAHRAHSSTEGVSHFLPSVSGCLIQKELEVMGKALQSPERPFLAILGGAKVSDKIGVINHLLETVDSIIIGGAMAYTFLRANGFHTGNSMVEEDKLSLALEIQKAAKEKGVTILLPVDSVIASEFKETAACSVTENETIPDGMMGLDIGPKSAALFEKAVQQANTVIWNGPMGVFEWTNFANGTKTIATSLANANCISIIGGGDSAAAIEQFGLANRMSHISTGGGASLEFLEGKVLPGIACLQDKA